MKTLETAIPDVKIITPLVHGDNRGFFLESYNKKDFANIVGLGIEFVQDNHSRSGKNVLRGLHYQMEHTQGKLIRVTAGEIFDVAVDLRKSSPTFGKWAGTRLNSQNHHILWVPPGFAHGFLVLSELADVLYKTTDYYDPDSDRCLIWNDPDVAIPWPIRGQPLLSPKDQEGVRLKDAEVYYL